MTEDSLCPASGTPCGCFSRGEPLCLPIPKVAPTRALRDGTEGSQALPDDNPKTRFGVAKPPLGLLPAPAVAHVAMAFADGDRKYGRANWREKPVTWSTYDNAARRHIALYESGETHAQDSGVHHLAHAAACLMILVDAEEAGTLNDDRPPPVNLQALYDKLTRKLDV